MYINRKVSSKKFCNVECVICNSTRLNYMTYPYIHLHQRLRTFVSCYLKLLLFSNFSCAILCMLHQLHFIVTLFHCLNDIHYNQNGFWTVPQTTIQKILRHTKNTHAQEHREKDNIDNLFCVWMGNLFLGIDVKFFMTLIRHINHLRALPKCITYTHHVDNVTVCMWVYVVLACACKWRVNTKRWEYTESSIFRMSHTTLLV